MLNLARNSKEASATNIEIHSSIKDSKLVIAIKDNGSGIPSDILLEIFSKQVTSKKFGNGIGLYSINQFLNKKNAKIDILSNSKDGLTLQIEIPIINESFTSNLVLIDDDKFIHHAWRMQSEKLGINFYSYFSADDFIENHNIHSKETPVYIDSNLRSGQKGEIRARDIYNLGFSNIFLTTSFTDIKTENYPWIKRIYSKMGPF
jgi:Histidine kinase-, DNA gyrase B-, and HSP90-like ATPase